MTQSESTEKLKLLLESIKDIPVEVINRVVKVELTWKILGSDIVPEVKIKFNK